MSEMRSNNRLPCAVLDSCVLFPPSLRNLFMWLAVEQVFLPKWTEEIHQEWIENALEDDAKKNSPSRLDRSRLERTRNLMNNSCYALLSHPEFRNEIAVRNMSE